LNAVAITELHGLQTSIDSHQAHLPRQREQAADAALDQLQGQRNNLHELLLEKTELVERMMKVFEKWRHSSRVGRRPLHLQLLFTLQRMTVCTLQKSGETSHSDSGLWSSFGATGNVQQDQIVSLQVRTLAAWSASC
jgi:hypothetical protein